MSPSIDSTIHDVSDTALWVAHYRALESERRDALFHDPLAERLVGARGKAIAESMRGLSRYTQWTVIIRTCIIDQYLQELIQNGVDTVINLGAGLDTRPYRLSLPKTLRWIEVDYPHMMDYKNHKLASEKPNCQLERISLDLADRQKRQELFSRVNAQAQKVLILTEGVLPYLTENQVAELAEDLRSQSHFCFWIAEFLSPQVYPYLNGVRRAQKMKNAPFQFFPKDWLTFFSQQGWKAQEIRYTATESIKLKRRIPSPWWGIFLYFFTTPKKRKQLQQMTGFALYIK